MTWTSIQAVLLTAIAAWAGAGCGTTDPGPGALENPSQNHRIPTATRSEVERLLEAQIADEDTAGFSEDQFKDLAAYGREKVVPVLIEILLNRSYEFSRMGRRENPASFKAVMKELSVMALGELGGAGALQALEALVSDDVWINGSQRLHEETIVAMHRLGKTQPLEDRLLEIRELADTVLKTESTELKEDACEQLFSLGLLLTRLKRRGEASKVFQEIISVIEKHKLDQVREKLLPSVSYNLACLSALNGDRRKAIQWLEKAVRAGFTDRAWIRADRDLDSIRNEEGYQKLLSSDELFEKKEK
jgi:hypothetical protein